VRRRDGFTLMEVLVGLVVASLALAAGFGALVFVGDRSRHAEQAAVAALEAGAVRALLADWLGGARLIFGDYRFFGQDGETLGQGSDELILPTTARTPLHEPMAVARLYIDEDPETPERGLVAELSVRLTDEPRRLELVPQAGRLRLRYLMLTAEGTEWVDAWVANRLPEAIELSLEPAPGDSLPPLLRLPLRVALETLR
jgi:prepilin-type N-terminal cleavage/methylation domain-containing protein